MSKNDIRDAVKITPAESLEQPSKILAYDDHLFISDESKGVHIVDNRDPQNPESIALISANGARDMAIKGNYLYIDHFTDLIVVDINNVSLPVIVNTIEDVFTDEGRDIGDEVIIDYTQEFVTISGPCEGTTQWFNREDVFFVRDNVVLESSADVPSAIVNNNANNQVGIAGSFSRFVIVDDGLYTVGRSSLRSLDIQNPVQPVVAQELPLGWLIETIFAYEDHLFVGSQEGMFILELRANQQVEYVADFRHSRACDPVFVTNNTAYVTLRDGRECGEAVNELLIVDISDIDNPDLLESYRLDHPNGLSVAEDRLFLAQGDYGLYVYDLQNRKDINELMREQLFHARDIVAFDKEHILVIGDDGLMQYAITDEIEFLSVIPVEE